MTKKPDTYTLIRGGKRLLWYTERLWQLSADFPVQSVAIQDIPEFQQNCWFQSRPPTIEEVAGHAKRIFAADLAYPVLLNDEGGLMDGGHRLSRAHLEGHTHIKAVQFKTLPEPDEVVAGDFVELKAPRLILREFVSHDLDALFDLYHLPETSEFESWSPHDSPDQTRDLLQHWLDESYQTPRQSYQLAIEFEGQLVGICGLDLGFGTETDDLRCGFLGVRVHRDFWRRGIASEALSRMLQFGFAELNLHRIHAGTASTNFASIGLLKKVGFSSEGRTRQSFPMNDQWVDYELFGKLHSDP